MFHDKNVLRLEVSSPPEITVVIPAISRARPARFWLLLVPFALVTGTFLLILVARTGAILLPSEGTDVFAPYAVVMPGQPGKMTESFPCRVYHGTAMAQTFACDLVLADDAFRKVSVFVAEGEIVEVTFHPRNMRAVELVWRWGYPNEISRLGDKYILQWNQPVSAIIESTPHFSMQAAVSFIMVTKPSV